MADRINKANWIGNGKSTHQIDRKKIHREQMTPKYIICSIDEYTRGFYSIDVIGGIKFI